MGDERSREGNGAVVAIVAVLGIVVLLGVLVVFGGAFLFLAREAPPQALPMKVTTVVAPAPQQTPTADADSSSASDAIQPVPGSLSPDVVPADEAPAELKTPQ
jgi:hypothetical protein